MEIPFHDQKNFFMILKSPTICLNINENNMEKEGLGEISHKITLVVGYLA